MNQRPASVDEDEVFCIGCGYSLRGLPVNRCPECGREFDPNDPRTMSHAKPLRPWQRWLLRPLGWPTITLALAASAVLVYLGWRPSWRPEPTAILLHEFRWPSGRTLPLTLADIVFYAAVILWLAFLGVLGAGRLARLLVPRVARRANRVVQPAPRRWAIILAAAVSVLFMVFGWQARICGRWIARAMNESPANSYRWNPWYWSPIQLSPQEARDVLGGALLGLRSASDRQCALRLLVESTGDIALPPIIRAAEREPDASLLAWELRIIGLCRDPSTAPMLIARLQDPRPEVRAAAADAIGILRKPSYSIADPNRSWVGEDLSLDTNPPIRLETLVTPSNFIHWNNDLQDEPAIPLSPSVRATLEHMMLHGDSSEEREAAARSLVNWPPAHYQLRVAEWGVWIDNNGSLALAKSIVDEIPPFVHGTGNDAASFSSYFLYPSVVTKPVIHITSDAPLAADIEVQIRQGRPWFAYPKPDDFGIGTDPDDQPYKPLAMVSGFTQPIQLYPDELNSPSVPVLAPCREGYPWLIPHHRQYASGGFGRVGIYSLSLRWQSIIISPNRMTWMKLPTVANDPRFGWWRTLRAVPSSWVTSRDETERFMYYDGPTRAKTPISAYLDDAGTQLTFTAPDFKPAYGGDDSRRPYLLHPLHPQLKPGLPECEGLYIQIHNGVLQGQYVLPDPAVIVGLDPTLPLQGDAVVSRFRRMLLDYGLTAPEAEGLIRVWTPRFFHTEGRRFILRMSPEQYARQCPLQMRPKPSELVRLGLVLSEFDRHDNKEDNP